MTHWGLIRHSDAGLRVTKLLVLVALSLVYSALAAVYRGMAADACLSFVAP